MIRAEGTALQRKKGKNRTVLVKTVFTDVQKTTVLVLLKCKAEGDNGRR